MSRMTAWVWAGESNDCKCMGLIGSMCVWRAAEADVCLLGCGVRERVKGELRMEGRAVL